MVRSLQRHGRMLSVIAFLAVVLVSHAGIQAQTKEPSKSAEPVREQAIPLMILCGSGFERWMANIDYLFGTIDAKSCRTSSAGSWQASTTSKASTKTNHLGC